MTLFRFLVPRRSSLGCADMAELVPDVVQRAPESPKEHLQMASSIEPQDAPQLDASLTDSDEAPLVTLKYCIGRSPVDMFRIDKTGERTEVTTVDVDTQNQDPVFFELHSKRSKWFKEAFGVKASQPRVYTRLKKTINDIFGKHKKKTWCVSKAGEPIPKTKVVDVQMGDSTLRVLPTRKSICIEISFESLTWLVNEVSTSTREAMDEDAATHEDIVDDPITHAVMHPFDKDDLVLLENHNIKWHPSKRSLMCAAEGGSKLISPCKIKLNVNLKKRKRKGDDKFLAYVDKQKAKALRTALDMATNAKAGADTVQDVHVSSPQGGQVSDEDTSDQSSSESSVD